jgi:transposase
MTGVETIARIRFEHFQNCKGIKRIARELGIARDTVRKVLRSGATEFSYKREVQPQRKLGLWVEALTQILESEDKLPRRERRSTIRLFEELRGRGYDGAHDSVHRFVKGLARRSRANAGASLHSAAVRSWRSLSVRLEP